MIRVYPGHEAMSRAAADLFAETAVRACASRGRFSVALAGGGTPKLTYELLALPPLRERVPWEQTHIFWGDERCVPPNDIRSNARMARENFLDRVPIPGDQVHPILCADYPAQAAHNYEALLRNFFRNSPDSFDLILLGLGENGHTASLFPHLPVLEEKERWVAEVFPADQTIWRVTFTLPLINRGRIIAFLVSGANKGKVLREVIEGPFEPGRLPAQLIAPGHGTLLWLVDREACLAAGLAGGEQKR